MKDSGIEWIGEIPNGWKVEKLKFHADFNPETEVPSFAEESEVSFVPMENLKCGYHNVTILPYKKVKKGYTAFSSGDILMAKVTPCLENGNLAIAENLRNDIGFGSTEINVIRCHDIYSKYLFYYLQTPKFIERATYDMFGVAGLKRLVPSFIPESYYPIPPNKEQHQIVDYLDRKCTEIDSVIKAKKNTNEKLKEYRQSVIYEAVTKGLDKTAKMKDSGIEWIGEIPNGWKVEKLKFHADFNPETEIHSFEEESEVSFVPMENLKCGYHNVTVVPYVKVQKGYTVFSSGDILMAKVTPCLENGNLAIAENLKNGIGFGSTEINVIRCHNIDSKYLFYYLQNPKFIERASYDMFGVAGLKRLVSSFIPESYYPIPPNDEQHRIADYLDCKCAEIDSVLCANEKTIEKLKEYRQSIIYEAVTGKLKVY